LDKNNLKLGVWSGNMVIENVNLKPEIIEMLELPLRLVKSSIGKMTIKIPWKKLTSMPVEITIENVFISLIPLAEWIFNDEKIVLKKIEALTDYCKKCMKRGLKKKKSEEKDKGYLDKMAIKIMDNIQLKVVNIHVRYETTYNWGITLEMLEIYTTSENWERSFIDRTEK
jgi:vacuolar protein sorting-associated protein 13A/C